MTASATPSAKLHLTELVLRDAHQSLLATRLRLEDMLPIASKLDQVGYWSMESWGGATFDACIRYLGEDPWHRIRELKKAMPNTKQQMLLRGQNLLGYRHYADDVVAKFVERAYANGVEVFRVFDAMNDPRNLQTAVKSVLDVGGHAQGTISYTVSPVHNLQSWLDLAKRIEDMGCHSLCIKDMAGLLKPYDAKALITGLKQSLAIPIAMQCHATTGLSTATYQVAIDAGIDMLDTAISPMSMTYGHSATETMVAIVEGTERDTGLDMTLLAEIADYFREVRKKYQQFEGSLKGVDGRILLAQVPGGMLTNMESQLKEQGAADKLDAVLKAIPKVREDLGYIPLVTPTSQIVGTQAVLNVLSGSDYATITKETAGVLKGEYGATPAPVNAQLQQRVLNGAAAITVRPADLLAPEVDKLTADLQQWADAEHVALADNVIDDVLTYALFNQIALKFLKNRGNADAFEPAPSMASAALQQPSASMSATTTPAIEHYDVVVEGKCYQVSVAPSGQIQRVTERATETGGSSQQTPVQSTHPAAILSAELKTQAAPLSGNIFKVLISQGQRIEAGQVLVVMEAMKMETEIRAQYSGTVVQLFVKEGSVVSAGEPLVQVQ